MSVIEPERLLRARVCRETTPQRVMRAELVQWIRDAGRVPVERDTLYNVLWSADESLAQAGHAAPVMA
jgi:hypothetical protein